jgi:hypothetical protein
MFTQPLDKKPTLAQPPNVKIICIILVLLYVSEESISRAVRSAHRAIVQPLLCLLQQPYFAIFLLQPI